MSDNHDEDLINLALEIYGQDKSVVECIKKRFNNASEHDKLRWKQILRIRSDVKTHMSADAYPAYVKSVFNVISIEAALKLGRSSEKAYIGKGLKLLSHEDQRKLLMGYQFSQPYTAFDDKSEYSPNRHLMFVAATRDQRFLDLQGFHGKETIEFCFTENHGCPCGIWLDQNKNEWAAHIDQLGKYLYWMRNAIAHAAQPVFMASYARVFYGESIPVELIDAFSISESDPDRYVTYSCKLDHRDFDRMTNEVVFKLMLEEFGKN